MIVLLKDGTIGTCCACEEGEITAVNLRNENGCFIHKTDVVDKIINYISVFLVKFNDGTVLSVFADSEDDARAYGAYIAVQSGTFISALFELERE